MPSGCGLPAWSAVQSEPTCDLCHWRARARCKGSVKGAGARQLLLTVFPVARPMSGWRHAMLVDKEQRTPTDLSRVALDEEWETSFWCARFGATPEELRA